MWSKEEKKGGSVCILEDTDGDAEGDQDQKNTKKMIDIWEANVNTWETQRLKYCI